MLQGRYKHHQLEIHDFQGQNAFGFLYRHFGISRIILALVTYRAKNILLFTSKLCPGIQSYLAERFRPIGLERDVVFGHFGLQENEDPCGLNSKSSGRKPIRKFSLISSTTFIVDFVPSYFYSFYTLVTAFCPHYKNKDHCICLVIT